MPDNSSEQNRKHWDEVVDIHFRHPDYHVQEFLEGQSTLRPIERRLLPDVNGKSLLHLFCQFGLDTLSWARLGADAVGVDISGRSIEIARELQKKSGEKAEFVQSGVLELKGKIERQFDTVFQSYGTHHWISDPGQWAQVVSHYLKSDGKLVVVDFHPAGLSLLQDIPYFHTGPRRYSDPDYCDRSYRPKEESNEWHHTLSDIVMAVIDAEFTVTLLEEHPGLPYRYKNDWIERDGYYYPPQEPTVPMMFALVARKETRR